MRVRSIVILMLGMLMGLVAYCATDDMLPAQDKIPIVRYMIPEAFVSYTPLSNAGELSEESLTLRAHQMGVSAARKTKVEVSAKDLNAL